MSAFYVGQRVRFVRAKSLAGLPFVGQETLIIAAGCRRGEFTLDALNTRDADYLLGLPIGSGGHLLADADQIEPVNPPGLESLDEINALYEPEPCTADVDSRGFHVPEHGRRL